MSNFMERKGLQVPCKRHGDTKFFTEKSFNRQQSEKFFPSVSKAHTFIVLSQKEREHLPFIDM
jgi:hypothetical protein